MAITAKFEADFSQFTGAVRDAETHLIGFEGHTKAMARAFAEMDNDRPFVRVNEAIGQTTNTLGSFRLGLSQVDRTLAQVGLNLTPQVAALNELSLAAGKTATQLGFIATAGLTLAAGIGGWKLGRAISEFFDLDKTIGDATAELLGFGSAASETTAHQMDVIARASQVAGFEVKSFAAAVEILANASDRLAASLQTPGAVMDRLRGEVAAAQRDYRGLSESQRENITRMVEWGESAAEIERIFKLHAGTVQIVIDRNKLLAEQEKVNAQIAEDHAAAINKVIAAQQKFISLAPLKPKDVTNIQEQFQPTGAFATILAEETAIREQAEAQTLLNQQMEEGLIIVGEYPAAHQAAGAAAVEATGAAQQGFTGLGSSITAAQQQVERFAVSMRTMMELGEAQRQFNQGRATTTQEALLRGFELTTARGGAPSGGGVVINVDARESFYDTPDGINRLATRVGDALVQQRRSVGGTA